MSIKVNSRPHATVTLEQVDRADELACKARAILACVRVASERGQDLPDDAIPGACWAVEDMIEELGRLSHGVG